MKKTIALFFISIFLFTGCATWKGIKKDTSDAWKATKKTTQKVWEDTKEAINEATE